MWEGGEVKEIIEQAQKELEQEKFKNAVEKYKEFLKIPWHKRLLPWEITIKIKRKKHNVTN